MWDYFQRYFFLIVVCSLLLSSCGAPPDDGLPSIEFSRVPLAEKGGAQKLDTIEGRVTGARAGQRVVLYARSGAWYIQPFTDQPFTIIRPDTTWQSPTHLGTEYAALLVEPFYQPPAVTDTLPKPGSDGVVTVAAVEGVPVFWRRTWFRLLVGLSCLLALFGLYRLRLRQVTRQLNVRFEERLAERTRIAQELHDTLLQGLISASMQLDVTVDRMPEDSPARRPLGSIQQLMGNIIEEGQNTVRGLRADEGALLDLREAFAHLQDEFAPKDEPLDVRVMVEGHVRPLHPLIRDEIYRIGREAITSAFRHSRAARIEVVIEYASHYLRLVVRDDGQERRSQIFREGSGDRARMRERAERIGGKLRIRQRVRGTEIELSVPGQIAFRTELPAAQPARLHPGKVLKERSPRNESEGDQ